MPIDNEQLICYSKTSRGRHNMVLVVVNLDPHHRAVRLGRPRRSTRSGWTPSAATRCTTCCRARASCGAARATTSQLDPAALPAHVFRLRRRVRSEHDFDYFL